MKKTKRKLIKTRRNYTYAITLPKEWIKKLGWRSKQALELVLEGEKIIVKDFPNQ